jgi:hypothetical protein
MVGLAAVCWALWKTRNVCFEKKMIKSPTEIVCMAVSFLSFWAGLQKDGDKEALEAGAEALKNAALFFHPGDATTPDNGIVLLH